MGHSGGPEPTFPALGGGPTGFTAALIEFTAYSHLKVAL
jgi:hypothetical protein